MSEPAPTRDHTERMLRGFGYPVQRDAHGVISLQGGGELKAAEIDVPADISSAAFLLVGASIAPGSDLLLTHVGINPTRRLAQASHISNIGAFGSTGGAGAGP